MATRRHQWSRDELFCALHTNQFVPYFQPKIGLHCGGLCSAEMLARWKHPSLGIIEPNDFIDVMEAHDLLGELTENLLHQALRCTQFGLRTGHRIALAVNISPRTLENIEGTSRLIAIVQEYGMSPSQITFEITETSTALRPDLVLQSLILMKRQGFEISVDDFGTGHSSLRLLNDMPFTELKIDRGFVKGISKGDKPVTILRAIVQLANDLGMRTVVEGIETREEFSYVRDLGCDLAQGYYCGRPMTYTNLLQYVRRLSGALFNHPFVDPLSESGSVGWEATTISKTRMYS
ncbi:EAL domain-containing protein [Noviherbaspirillum saxi]|uniref:EAL domain-containing protein n=1 Tax=Noviherbaspirillum saxi TaxID=2320863 RepID=A0A3A3FGY8_9BURK|nr:EAL domain-containing protein [Noviherbaspirillum saxi]RJF92407.1 EAL domain-containing protein [Noviherbaspirillum saxi]